MAPALLVTGLFEPLREMYSDKFKETQKSFANKIESFTAKQKEKKKSLFDEVEKKLKKELEKK